MADADAPEERQRFLELMTCATWPGSSGWCRACATWRASKGRSKPTCQRPGRRRGTGARVRGRGQRVGGERRSRRAAVAGAAIVSPRAIGWRRCSTTCSRTRSDSRRREADRRDARVGGAEARIAVDDDGPGIPEGTSVACSSGSSPTALAMPRREHVGLGLAIAKQIVEQLRRAHHRGEPPAGGARFDIRLPIAAVRGISMTAGVLRRAPG